MVSALWSLRGDGDFTPASPTESGVRFRAGRARGIAPLADIYLPAREGTGASVVLVHGGGFVLGSRKMKPMRYLATRLVRSGVAVCAVDYRMIFRGGRLEEAVDDVHAAIGFWRRRAAELGLDASRVSLAGLSAGGALSMIVAAQDRGLHRLACCFGVYDFEHASTLPASVVPTLLFRTTDRVTWRRRAPLSVEQPEMPTLLLHGTEDGLVPAAQAERVAEVRRERGLPTKLVLYPGAPHGFFNMPCPERELGARELCEHLR